MKKKFAFMMCTLLLMAPNVHAGKVEIQAGQLFVDNKPQPQLFGAEVQYFRLRGGYGRNIPRAKVIALWNKVLDHFVEAKMTAISFYIPWDFHEYAPGKFDFDGTVDEDGDGNPDYPSRDLKTFFKMIEERGIRHIMVRPGPYVNAEWGFLGFGAIPLWFHQQYPESHMHNAQGLKTKLYDYHDPHLLERTSIWFRELYQQVLKDKIGPGKPISFLQIDNETNYMWQSIYDHDYGPGAVGRYRDFLKSRYFDIASLNAAHHRQWKDFSEVQAPITAGVNIDEDQDWYRFADVSISTYLTKLRRIWEGLGVTEPNILFTLADSYNAPKNGLLPNYQLHNEKGSTGLLTVNLYPKTFETIDHPLLNLPFKSDLDVKSAESASEAYFGSGLQWAMGPEIQGGWWKGIEVSPAARQQTYLSVIGHGLKSFFVYYFHEGDQWQVEWAKQQISPLYDELKANSEFAEIPNAQLPAQFWNTLQDRVDHRVLVGFNARAILNDDPHISPQLYFDAPLDPEGNPRDHFVALKNLGENIIQPYGPWLGKALEVTDKICLLKDVTAHVPSAIVGVDSVLMNSDWSAGLLAYTLHAGLNPKILHWGISSAEEFQNCRVILRQDPGATTPSMTAFLKKIAGAGVVVVNLLGDSLPQSWGLQIPHENVSLKTPAHLDFGSGSFDAASSPLAHYNLTHESQCAKILSHENSVAGYRCPEGKGAIVQIGALFYDAYNSDRYGKLPDLVERESFLSSLTAEFKIKPALQLSSRKDPIVAFARRVPLQPEVWITLKSASEKVVATSVLVSDLISAQNYCVQDLLTKTSQKLSGHEIQLNGFSASLPADGSKVYRLSPTTTGCL